MRFETTDSIVPVLIEHSVDEIWNGDDLEQFYNFIDYHFEGDGAYLRAHVYVDEMRNVSLFGPFEGRESITKVSAPEMEQAVLTYLQRRFLTVARR